MKTINKNQLHAVSRYLFPVDKVQVPWYNMNHNDTKEGKNMLFLVTVFILGYAVLTLADMYILKH